MMTDFSDINDFPFNIDWECQDEEKIERYRSGNYFIDLAKSGTEKFEITFASFGDARCYYQYIWDNSKLVQKIVENADLFNDDELDDGLDDELWSEAIENGYCSDIVDKAIENGDCESKILFEK